MITIRSLHKDIARYNAAENAEEAQEEFGWKLVHGKAHLTPKLSIFYLILWKKRNFSRKIISRSGFYNGLDCWTLGLERNTLVKILLVESV